MRLYHNMPSIDVYRRYKDSLVDQSKAMGKVSSGRKVQSYRDDPNAMAKGKKLELQVRGLQMATRNIQDGMSLMQVADGGMQSIEDSAQRIKELIVQAGGVTSNNDKNAIQLEIDQLRNHINDTAERTGVNGISLLGSGNNGKTIDLLAGNYADDIVKLPLCDLTTTGLGIDNTNITVNDVDNSLKNIDVAIDSINRSRSKYGGLMNRLESTYNNNNEISLKVEGAASAVVDSDIALEMIEYSKSSLLVETGLAIITQTNKIPQDVLRILENIKNK